MTGKLTQIDQVSSRGGVPVHLDINRKGTLLTCANYIGASVSHYKIKADGRLEYINSVKFGGGSQVNKARQMEAHPHSAYYCG